MDEGFTLSCLFSKQASSSKERKQVPNTQFKCPNCNEPAIERREGEPTWKEGTLVACTDLENCACGHDAVDCPCVLHNK